MILQIVVFLLAANIFCASGYRSDARVSTIELWRNETRDGDVVIAHGINSWPALLEQLNKPVLERTAVIEGDVLLYKQRKHKNRAIPLMRTPSKIADRITFKEWLQEVTKLRKIMKINVRSTEVLRPVLQYLLAAADEITSPVVLHANIFRSPRSPENVVDAHQFLEGAQTLYPDATLSIGWTKNNITDTPLEYRKFGWREVFKTLSLIKDIQQALMISLRLTIAALSTEEISFILGIRETIAILIWSDSTDVVDDWSALMSLRSGSYGKRIIFDLDPSHRDVFRSVPFSFTITDRAYDRDEWRRVEFPYASSTASGAVESNDGVVFLGWPNSFLISLKQPFLFPAVQTLSSKLMFVKKGYVREENRLAKSGLALYLVDKVDDIQSPDVTYGVKVFIGYKGRISIENRDSVDQHYQIRAVGQLKRENCYYFELIDRGWRLELSVWGRLCGTDERSGRTDIYLDTPVVKSRKLRNVIVAKTGESGIDMLLQGLKHNAASTRSALSAVLLLILIRIFDSL